MGHIFFIEVPQTRPAFLSGQFSFSILFLLVPMTLYPSHAGSEHLCLWLEIFLFIQPMPPHPLGQLWFHIIQGTSLLILCAPSATPNESWHLPRFTDICRTTCVPPSLSATWGQGLSFIHRYIWGPRKASEILKGIQTLAELKWKVANPLSVFYFHNKGKPVYLK